jgi:hypothetical protein
MAKSPTPKSSKAESLTISPSAKKMMDKFSDNNKEINRLQYQIDDESIFDTEAELSKTAAEISSTIQASFSSLLGMGDDFSTTEVNNILSLATTIKNGQFKNANERKKQIDKLKETIASTNNSHMMNMLNTRKQTKAQLYASYDLLLTMIPKMQLAVNTMVNSIISPDDYTKDSLQTFFDSNTIASDQISFVKKNLDELVKKYGVNKNLKDDVKDYLVKGELFYAILSMNQEVKRALHESQTHTKPVNYKKITTLFTESSLQENVFSFSEDKEIFKSCKKLFWEGKDDKPDTEVLSELNYLLDNALVIGSSNQFLNEDFNAAAQMTNNVMLSQEDPKQDKDIDDLKFTSDSAVLKKLLAENVVKLEYNSKVYGYVYLDTVETDTHAPKLNGEQNINITTNSPMGTVLYTANDIPATPEGITNGGPSEMQQNADSRLQFLASVFANKLSRSENISLLKDNESLKNAIYYSLKTKEILKKNKIRLTFFKANEVVHIDRKSSIFDNVLFFAKMYIATLITILMQNIIRGADKRAYYIEVGMENDIANSVNSTIKDIKSKDITGLQNMDVFSILNVVGDFNDYYFPTIDGEKPITIENVEGLTNKSLDDEFLTWLSNNIFSGMGLPSAFLTEIENIDFAKTLSMQNARFIRDIVGEQVILGPGYSKVLRQLFKIEYHNLTEKEEGNEDTNPYSTTAEDKDKKEGDNQIDIMRSIDEDSVEVKFPSPMSLNMANMVDQMSNINQFADPLVDCINWGDKDAETGKVLMKRELYKEYVTGIDWEKFDGMVSKVMQDLTKLAIKKNVKDASVAEDFSDAVNAQPPSAEEDAGLQDDVNTELNADDTGASDIDLNEE